MPAINVKEPLQQHSTEASDDSTSRAKGCHNRALEEYDHDRFDRSHGHLSYGVGLKPARGTTGRRFREKPYPCMGVPILRAKTYNGYDGSYVNNSSITLPFSELFAKWDFSCY